MSHTTNTLEWAVLAELHVFVQGQTQTLFQELATLYLDELPERLSVLHQALQTGDQEARNRILHILKGSSGILGAHRLMTLVIQWSNSDMTQNEEMKQQFMEEMQRVSHALEDVCKQNNE